MKFSIIIPLYNQMHYVPQICKSLSEQTFKDFEVIFCDDGSNDQTYEFFIQVASEIIEFPFKYLRLWPKRGMRLAKVANMGFRVAQGEYLIMMAGDSFLDKDYLWYMNEYADPDCILCGTRFHIDGARLIDYDYRIKRKLIPLEPVMVMRNAMDSLTGNGLCVPKKAYEEHGYWDERIEGYGGDDTEVIARLYYKGYVCWSIPAAMIFHHYHKSSDSVNYKKVLKMIKEYAK